MDIVNKDTFNKFNRVLMAIIESENFLKTRTALDQFIVVRDAHTANVMYTMEYNDDLVDVSFPEAEKYSIYVDLLSDRTPGSLIYSNANYEEFSEDEFQRRYEAFNATFMNEFENKLNEKLNKVLSQRTEIPPDFFDFIFNDFLLMSAYLSFSKTEDFLIEEQLKAYINGAMPCGWCGDYPEGKLVVYLPE